MSNPLKTPVPAEELAVVNVYREVHGTGGYKVEPRQPLKHAEHIMEISESWGVYFCHDCTVMGVF